MDTSLILNLSDDDFRELVTQQLHKRSADPEAWEALTSPNVVTRTHETLAALHRDVSGVMRTRKAEREMFRSECFARGEAGRQEWYSSLKDYEDWRRRAGNFASLVQDRLSSVRKIQKDINWAANNMSRESHRRALRRLALAVEKHQAAHARAGGIAEQADYELWNALQGISIPIGDQGEMVSLRDMLDVYWREVTPVSAVAEARAGMEGVMRSAPAGRSGRFEGVPKARAVGSDRKLA